MIAGLTILVRLRALLGRSGPGTGTTLVICFGAIGDLLLLSATVRATSPDDKLVLACTRENRVAATLFGDVYAAVEVIELRKPTAIMRLVARHRIRAVIDSTQWANVSALHLGVARVRHPHLEVRGFRTSSRVRNPIYTDLVDHSASHHEVENFAALLGRPDLDPAALVVGRPADARTVALHLWPSGARSHLKEWPLDHWIELARSLHDEGYGLVATGGPADQERTATFIERTGVPIDNLAGAISLHDLYLRFQEDIRVCVSVNTGTMHLAALAGAAVVALNGPTDPRRWGPIGPYAISLQPSSGNFGYLSYGFEYPALDEDAYALDRLEVKAAHAAVHRVMA